MIRNVVIRDNVKRHIFVIENLDLWCKIYPKPYFDQLLFNFIPSEEMKNALKLFLKVEHETEYDANIYFLAVSKVSKADMKRLEKIVIKSSYA